MPRILLLVGALVLFAGGVSPLSAQNDYDVIIQAWNEVGLNIDVQRRSRVREALPQYWISCPARRKDLDTDRC